MSSISFKELKDMKKVTLSKMLGKKQSFMKTKGYIIKKLLEQEIRTRHKKQELFAKKDQFICRKEIEMYAETYTKDDESSEDDSIDQGVDII